ncbi:Bcr/CflA family efflux MFS transporter [Thermoanaerobacterium butyriciformans]|uniref:Bcr/CflA family efflux transporter n=1 Tax=Thermoanaerobacterium butyriciformans TaxID=1702242 RepID=A0ABS4NBM2_9THEO|nr:Bcr/CflA family efflux MFS transporter [Thermoanaerobacterium butyriciformans]MBP2071072.1 DHA1 family bicyclomycin/chloramphenicol resistance-like MFS transporter [Thermoanaerobacterium butyriciformans]
MYDLNDFNISKKQQRYLGNKGLIIFLALLSAFVPLSTDLYLPALPTMSKYFNVAVYKTNLTLILFFVFFSFATLIWGPLSDKYGRRPILILGLICYMVASFLCALSLDIYQLIIFRILQAVGAGAASAVATAIVKDVYEGRRRESILALVQSMVVICPAVAPTIGALLLKFTSWRGVFLTQAILGAIIVAGSVVFQETIGLKNNGSFLYTVGRIGVVIKNLKFTALLIIFSMVSIPLMAFISPSSYIYQDYFGLSEQKYSYFFAFNAAGMLIGPLLYVRLSSYFKRYSIINVCFLAIILSGIIISILGRFAPWLFAISLLPSTIAGSCIRPPGTYLMLEQQKEDTGSVSSLISSFSTIMGSVGMIIVSFNTGNLVEMVGIVNIIFGILCGFLWFVAKKVLLCEK